jgi:hypothetical protein
VSFVDSVLHKGVKNGVQQNKRGTTMLSNALTDTTIKQAIRAVEK